MNYLQIVSEVTKVMPVVILSESEKAEIVEARQLCMYFYRFQYGLSYTGKILKRHHATVKHGFNKISDLLSVGDKRTVKLVEEIKLKASVREEISF